MFKDRKDAGKQVGIALQKYVSEQPVVLGIPRGGVEVGYYAAHQLNAEFSLIITRKLPFPDNPESGFGAIAEDGSVYFHETARQWVDKSTIQTVIQQQQREIERRKQVLGISRPSVSGRTVILVDDGIAMGSTMMASIRMVKKQQPQKLVVASPVASPVVAEKLHNLVDETIILETPPFFQAVAQVYENWYDVSDDEVLDILHKVHNQ